MKKTDAPGWPASGMFPFMPFPVPGMAGPSDPAAAPAGSPLLQGVSGGIDLMKDFWSRLPGTTPVPGFLVPTVDVDELDKRIADLRAAESWVEVNLNLLRTTIQGLEVQRHTIAAIHSLSWMGAQAATAEAPTRPPATNPLDAASMGPPAKAPSPAATDNEPGDKSNVPAGPPAFAAGDWLGYLQDQFVRVAGAAIGPASTPTSPASTPTPRKRSAARKKPARRPATAVTPKR